MTSYKVFPGIELTYYNIHRERCILKNPNKGNILEIHHCREGRVECEFQESFCYLSKGDMAIGCKDSIGNDFYFPTKHYHGLTVTINMDSVPKCLSCILQDVMVQPAHLLEKYCHQGQCYIMRAKPCLEHIFSELYSVPDSIKKGYFKVKILELLLFLDGIEIEAENHTFFYPRTQVALAKDVCQYLFQHMNQRITLEELSSIFHVSGTQIKTSFKCVYGQSIYAYIRCEKMHAAARLLKQTDDTVLNVAGRFGYDNGSKFAKAFKNIIGMTPNEYRKEFRDTELVGKCLNGAEKI